MARFDESDFADDNPADNSSGDWILSYSDVVTVLMIFFIIFYVIEKKLQKKPDDLAKIINVEVVKNQENVQKEFDSQAGSNKTLEEIIEKSNLVKEEKVSLTVTPNRLTIHFHDKEFFQSGSANITQEGMDTLKKFSEMISPHQDKIWISIQGHTDNAPVIAKWGRWWRTNMELSALRALRVYGYLQNQGLREEHMYVTGRGPFAPYPGGNENSQHLNRRISVIIFSKNLDEGKNFE